MNNFKFRVWDLDKKEFTSNYHELFVPCWTKDIKTNIFTYSQERTNTIIQQWTGMKDKNGVLVFDGDFLKFPVQSEFGGDSDEDIDYEIGNVFYVSGTFMIDGGYPLHSYADPCNPNNLKNCIVVGNEFEHPELREHN